MSFAGLLQNTSDLDVASANAANARPNPLLLDHIVAGVVEHSDHDLDMCAQLMRTSQLFHDSRDVQKVLYHDLVVTHTNAERLFLDQGHKADYFKKTKILTVAAHPRSACVHIESPLFPNLEQLSVVVAPGVPYGCLPFRHDCAIVRRLKPPTLVITGTFHRLDAGNLTLPREVKFPFHATVLHSESSGNMYPDIRSALHPALREVHLHFDLELTEGNVLKYWHDFIAQAVRILDHPPFRGQVIVHAKPGHSDTAFDPEPAFGLLNQALAELEDPTALIARGLRARISVVHEF